MLFNNRLLWIVSLFAGGAILLSCTGCRFKTAGNEYQKDESQEPGKTDKSENPVEEQETKTLKVLQFNIFADAYPVEGGEQAIIDVIDLSNPDIVLLSEVMNHVHDPFVDYLVSELAKRGKHYYGHGYSGYHPMQGKEVGLISKFPYIRAEKVENGIAGGVYLKAHIDVAGHDLLVYSAHMDANYYACWNARGFDSMTGHRGTRLPGGPVSDGDKILEENRKSTRDESIAAFIDEVKTETADIIIIGGDFNEPSHLDWCEATKNEYGHNGCVVNWDCSYALVGNGFKDAYRELFPNPLTHPGFTYPAIAGSMDMKWTLEADERERLDFIYYKTPSDKPAFELKNMYILGTKQSVAGRAFVTETTEDKIIEPDCLWPSDHKATMATFSYTK